MSPCFTQLVPAECVVTGMQGLYCSPHKQPGMINVKQKHCAFEGCTNRPSFNFPGAILATLLIFVRWMHDRHAMSTSGNRWQECTIHLLPHYN